MNKYMFLECGRT